MSTTRESTRRLSATSATTGEAADSTPAPRLKKTPPVVANMLRAWTSRINTRGRPATPRSRGFPPTTARRPSSRLPAPVSRSIPRNCRRSNTPLREARGTRRKTRHCGPSADAASGAATPATDAAIAAKPHAAGAAIATETAVTRRRRLSHWRQPTSLVVGRRPVHGFAPQR